MRLWSFGEVLFDVYPDKECIGGAPLNFAAHAVRHGDEASLVSAVGADARGEAALRQLASWGIDTSLVAVLPDRPTGICRVTLDERAVPSYALAEDTAWDAIPVPTEGVADVLYFGTLALRGEQNRRTVEALLKRGGFRHVFADVNIRPPFFSKAAIKTVFENATIVKISDEECPTVCELLEEPMPSSEEALCRKLAARFTNLRVVILTKGGDGACAFDRETDTFCCVPAVPTTVVSTVGAGDSFSAAFLSKFMRGEPHDACLKHASSVAAFVVSRLEAIPDYSSPLVR